MNVVLADPITVLGGMPFLDDGFSSGRLLAGVAAVRHVEAERTGNDSGITDAEVDVWLDPARVLQLRGTSRQMPTEMLTDRYQRMIAETLAELAELIPSWAPLMKLPVVFSLLSPSNGAISASSRMWPQQVMLADEAFATPAELGEQVVHELSHQWLYLIEELWALEIAGARHMTLPSGTADRTPAEVLGAAHVVAALIRMHRASTTTSASRLAYLSDYGLGCLELLAALDGDLTDAGRSVVRRLKEEW